VTWTWAEPFAGAAACALRLVGGERLKPPVAWMGGKRRYARAILDAMGVPEGPPSRVLLADAGPWGWVWPLLLSPVDAGRVAANLRAWAGEHPRELWQRLAAQPPADALHERAAQWLWLQARSASGVPIWWDGWRLRVEGRSAPQSTWDRYGEDNAGRWQAMSGRGTPQRPGFNTGQASRDGWRASDGRGDPRTPGQRADAGRWEKGNEGGRVQPAGHGQRGATWRMGEDPAKASRGDRTVSQKGTARGQTGGLVDPCTIAARAEALARAFADVDVQVHHGGAHELGPLDGLLDVPCPKCLRPRGARCVTATGKRPHHARLLRARASGPSFVYLDPPYVGATGYGWDMPRAEVLALARRWADAGAVVAVSEAEPLALEGWHHLELTRDGGKPEWLTLSRAPARAPARQASLFPSPSPIA
jgi:hypothetical protein